MRVAARLAARELRGGLAGGLRGFRVVLLCLMAGVAAIAAVGTVRAAIEGGLAREGAALLGGDAEAELTYRAAAPEEREWFASLTPRLSEVIDLRSLLAAGPEGAEERALTEVRAVDGAYPLLGAVALDPPMPLAEALDPPGDRPGLVAERSLADRLGVGPGDAVRLGTAEFVLSAILVRYPDNTAAGLGLGPRSLALAADVRAAGLLADGSLYHARTRLDLREDADLDALAAEAEARWGTAGMRWTDSREGAQGLSEAVERLGRFLVLVGLAGLAVGGVGVATAVAAYVAAKAETIATLRTLGASRATVFWTFGLQVAAIAAAGIVAGVVIGGAVPLLAAPWIESRLPVPAAFRPYPGPLLEAALYGALAAGLFALWPLSRAADIRAATLYREALSGGRALPRWPYAVALALLLAALVGSAAVLSGSAALTLWTAGGIAAALVALALAARLARAVSRRLARLARGKPALRLALGAVAARGGEATPVVLALGLGLSVLAAVGQIDGNLRRAITEGLPEVAPSYFVLDIPSDGVDAFRALLADEPGVPRVEAAPMLRGLVTAINGVPAEEAAEGHWVVRGDRGITYADALPAGTTLTAGEWWPEGYDGPPLVSVSAEEAAEIGLALGDTLTLNVLGREITATVASFREVEFEQAGLGFVLLLDGAALRGAPHTWISTVYADEASEGRVLRDIARAFPTATAVSVREAIAEAARIVAGVAAAVRVAAGASLLTGLIVLVGAAAAGERARAWEAAVLKALGAGRPVILRSFALRALILGVMAAGVALAAGTLGAWGVMRFAMDAEFRPDWGSAGAILAGGVLATLATGLAFAWRPLAVRPARMLRARD